MDGRGGGGRGGCYRFGHRKQAAIIRGNMAIKLNATYRVLHNSQTIKS